MNLVALPGSERKPILRVEARLGRPAEFLSAIVQATVVLKTASESIAKDVYDYARLHNLGVQVSGFTARLTGRLADLESAFGVRVQQVRLATKTQVHRTREGPIMVPENLVRHLTAVLGMDDRPVARPHFKKRSAAGTLNAFTPTQVATLYNMPQTEGRMGEGREIAIMEMGGGYPKADLDAYFAMLGYPTPSVSDVSILGALNQTGSDADGEVELDIEVAGGIAPKAKFLVYFVPNTEQGAYEFFVQLPTGVDAGSVSWGGPEGSWSAGGRSAINQAIEDCTTRGITITVASGDNGDTDSTGGPAVDFPSSSSFALGCGGTTLTATASAIESEIVWGTNDPDHDTADYGGTGGGFSQVFSRPAYQPLVWLTRAGGTGEFRGVPDVCGVADPNTGFLTIVDNSQGVIGGTSAVAPLWAGLITLLNNVKNKRLGFLHPALYAMQAKGHGFHQITVGNNGLYKAGWDYSACCGLGSPNGRSILKGFEVLGI